MFSDHIGRNRIICLGLTIAALLSLSWAAGAAPARRVPAFEVHRAEGVTENSSGWNMKGKWVLIYVEGQCGPCVHLLNTLTKEKYPNLAPRTIIIVGATQPTQLNPAQTRFRHLAEAKWYADPSRNAVKALGLQGAPVILGVEDGAIQWSISGIPPAPELLPRILKRWSAPARPAPTYQPATGNPH